MDNFGLRNRVSGRADDENEDNWINENIIRHQPHSVQPNDFTGQVVPSAPLAEEFWRRRNENHVPPGLEYLTAIDQLLIHQQVEVVEVFTSWQTRNKYLIKNSLGQQIFQAIEESGTLARQICGSSRGFIFHIIDNNGQEVLRVRREFKCCAGFSCCADCEACAHLVTVESPVGHEIGFIKQRFGCCEYNFGVYDEHEDEILKFSAHFTEIYCKWLNFTKDINFNISTADGSTSVGNISKQWGGILREVFTTADNFAVTFPLNLDVRLKALLLGAVFLIDFMFFESNPSSKSSGN